MKYRIAIWASIGFLVAGGWGLYFAALSKDIPIQPSIDILACLTQPIAVLGRHYPLSLYLVLFVNAATYVLIGFIVEGLRRQFLKRARLA